MKILLNITIYSEILSNYYLVQRNVKCETTLDLIVKRGSLG